MYRQPSQSGDKRERPLFRQRRGKRELDRVAAGAALRRLAKALRIARMPKTTASVLRVLNRAGLLGRNIIIVGANALYAYEAAAGVQFDSRVMETADVDILWEARSRLTPAADLRGASLIELLRQADRSFEPATARR